MSTEAEYPPATATNGARDGDRDVREVAEELVDRLLTARVRPGTAVRPTDLCALTGPEDSAGITAVLAASRAQLLAEPSLLRLDANRSAAQPTPPPLRIVGCIRGHFEDLLSIFTRLKRQAAVPASSFTSSAEPHPEATQTCPLGGADDDDEGFPPHARYLFLGGYVNRGRNGIECVVLLLCLKLLFPKHVYLLRGSDECAGMTRSYGFYDEVKRRFDVELWKRFTDVFNCLPIAALVAGRILCVHGGVSPELVSLDQIADIRRPTDVPDSGLLCDLLWADPDPDEPEWSANGRCHALDFGIEAFRGVASKVGFEMLVRSHQVVERGHEFPFPGSREVVTLFSAPNYCDEFDNDGAVMLVGAAASTTTSAPSGDITCAFMVLPRLHDGGDTSWRARARNM